MTTSAGADWVDRFADEVIAESDRRAAGRPIVCASGISPSGPIHLGNLREVMTPHLVADEIRRRGREVVHLLSWDDYDRFRRVPAGFDPTWGEHIGKPLTAVPPPHGSAHENWAEHFKAPMVRALKELGIECRELSQTEMYTSGVYRQEILTAMRERARIDSILGRYRTKVASPTALSPASADGEEAVAITEALEGSGAASEDDGAGVSGYYPYKPYCANCGTDRTTITSFDDTTTELTYTCACGFGETVVLSQFTRGKLVWKVDWPMRWAHEGVIFEPSGVDHSSPGSSFVVGSRIVSEVFAGKAPIGPMYAFVGISGMAKMSSSRGAVPTPEDALAVMEPAVLRWLYTRRRPNQSFKISFDQELHRVYDEWDALDDKAEAGKASAADTSAHARAIKTCVARMPRTPRRIAFRTLASIVDITTGEDSQLERIIGDLDPGTPISGLDEVRPRLDKAKAWVQTQLADDQRTKVRSEPDERRLQSLDDQERESLRLLVAGLDDGWSLDGLTRLLYGVPKLMAGLPLDTRPTEELKASQRKFFILVYELLIGRDTGPRLPTLLLAIGADRVRSLLSV